MLLIYKLFYKAEATDRLLRWSHYTDKEINWICFNVLINSLNRWAIKIYLSVCQRCC